jgi:hypothetical protein
VPAATERPLFANVATAARGVLQLALDAVNTDEFYARFLRPGFGVVLTRPTSAAAPACHASANATAATASTGTIETMAFYPHGDATCSKSPTRILEWAYEGTHSGAPIAAGYQLSYALSGHPATLQLAEVEVFEAILYDMRTGSASLNLADSQTLGLFGSPSGGPFVPTTPPAPGTFPATFPSGLATPKPGAVAAPYFAAYESGAVSKAGISGPAAQYYDKFSQQNPALQTNTNDAYVVSSSGPDAAGRVTLSWSDTAPYYSVDSLSDGVSGASVAFPLPPADVSWPLLPLGPLSQQTSALNFPVVNRGTATYGPDGTLEACSHTITDEANAVSAKATCVDGGSKIEFVVTDLNRSSPATTPAVISIDPYGNGAGAGSNGLAEAVPTYTVRFDNSKDQIVEFTIQECSTDSGPC